MRKRQILHNHIWRVLKWMTYPIFKRFQHPLIQNFTNFRIIFKYTNSLWHGIIRNRISWLQTTKEQFQFKNYKNLEFFVHFSIVLVLSNQKSLCPYERLKESLIKFSMTKEIFNREMVSFWFLFDFRTKFCSFTLQSVLFFLC